MAALAMKRIVLFVLTNLAVMVVLGITASLLGVNRFLTANGLNLGMLLAFAAVIGFGGYPALPALLASVSGLSTTSAMQAMFLLYAAGLRGGPLERMRDAAGECNRGKGIGAERARKVLRVLANTS